jgi:hypothetical protein
LVAGSVLAVMRLLLLFEAPPCSNTSSAYLKDALERPPWRRLLLMLLLPSRGRFRLGGIGGRRSIGWQLMNDYYVL